MYMNSRTEDCISAGVGHLLRRWRRRRKLSQSAVAADAGVSTRHLSFIETGRTRPSRAMVVRLAQALAVPLAERNALLLAAGYAPAFGERDLADPALAPVREALGWMLAAQEPYPALLVDRRWDIRASNRGARLLTDGVGAAALKPAPNLVRLLLHPAGLAARARNLEEWGPGLLWRVRDRACVTCDPGVESLYEEVSRYPGVARAAAAGESGDRPPVVAQRFRSVRGGGEIALFGSVATFAGSEDATVAELAIEAFFPADAATRRALRLRGEGSQVPKTITPLVNAGM